MRGLICVSSLLFVASTIVLASPPEVPDLGWCGAQKNCLTWSAVTAAKYRLYRGENASLPCVLNPSLDSCQEGTYASTTTGPAINETPAAGTMFWFLVTAIDESGEGTPGSATAGPRSLNDTGACTPVCSPAGSTCSNNSECCSASCNGGVCQSNCCAPTGALCAQNSECCNGACVAGQCQGPCAVPGDCPGSDSDCASRTCVSGTCGVSYAPNGTPTPSQVAGDCSSKVCDGQGNVVATADNGDVPVDNNQCTGDTCIGGVPSNPPAPVNQPCNQNGGVFCDGQGACVQCNSASQCGTGSECQNVACVVNTCNVSNLPSGTPSPAQIPGDCSTRTCDGSGNVLTSPDNTDLPYDGNQCTTDSCVAGVPSYPPAPAGQPCNQNGGIECNGAGQCVQCLAAADCPGSDTVCHSRTCTAYTCGVSNAAAGTAAGNPVPGDCQTNVCDGMGNIVGTADDADVPVDGNQCTNDACVGGVPSNPPAPVNFPCSQNGGVVCNGSGSCVQCNVAQQCPGSDTECQARTCTANTCGFSNAPMGSTCTGGVCDGSGTCVIAPQVSATTPADGATAIASTSVAVTFSQAMNPATLTGQTSAGACSGSIQVSLDGFASCVAFSSAAAAMSAGNTVATFVPAPGLLVNRAFKIRVTTAAQNGSGIGLASTYTQATGFTTTSPNLCDGSLVISQVYGSGGLTGASYKNDFIELHNRGTSTINVSGMSVQYASATGTTWLKTNLSGTIAPGAYYLVQEFSGGANGASLPTPDVIGTTDMSGSNGKLALVSNQTALSGSCPAGSASVLDFVGYGSTANCNEGGSNAPSPSATTAVLRAQGGCADVNANSSDFASGTATPRNTGSATSVCSCTVLNESNAAAEADYCVIQFPSTLSVQTATSTGSIYGQIFELGVTEPAGPASLVRSQVGYGLPTANPQYDASWKWFNATYNVQSGNNDEYQSSFVAPSPGSYRYVYRFSLDAGVSWSYCDTNQGDGGSGANPGLTFDLGNEGVLTVTP